VRRAVTALALAAVLASPGAALAQGDPYGPLPAPAPAPVTTQQPASTPTTSDTGGLNGTQEALIVAAGMVLLAGIGWAILRDARERAPVADGSEPTAEERAQRRSAQQQARARAKAKAARAQRKRNRARR
jgi:hypothetical protein